VSGLRERITAILTGESAPDGTLALALRAVDGADGFALPRTTLALAFWRLDAEVVRVSIKSLRTGTIAYLQGGSSALELVSELELQLLPARERPSGPGD
jgi:hypothetical protein